MMDRSSFRVISFVRIVNRLTAAPGLAVTLLVLSSYSFSQLGQRMVVIAVPTDDQFYVGKTYVPREQLVSEIEKAFKPLEPDEQVVYIKLQNEVRSETLIQLIADLRANGYDRIGLLANKGEQTKPENGLAKDSNNSGSPIIRNEDGPQSAGTAETVSVRIVSDRTSTRVSVEGAVAINAQIQTAIRKQLHRRKVGIVKIILPAELSYGQLVTVIDQAKAAGAKTIVLSVDASTKAR